MFSKEGYKSSFTYIIGKDCVYKNIPRLSLIVCWRHRIGFICIYQLVSSASIGLAPSASIRLDASCYFGLVQEVVTGEQKREREIYECHSSFFYLNRSPLTNGNSYACINMSVTKTKFLNLPNISKYCSSVYVKDGKFYTCKLCGVVPVWKY
jgi:hypothetical protein